MVKLQPGFKYSEFHVNYFTIFSLINTLSTDVTKSLQCKATLFQCYNVALHCNDFVTSVERVVIKLKIVK